METVEQIQERKAAEKQAKAALNEERILKQQEAKAERLAAKAEAQKEVQERMAALKVTKEERKQANILAEAQRKEAAAKLKEQKLAEKAAKLAIRMEEEAAAKVVRDAVKAERKRVNELKMEEDAKTHAEKVACEVAVTFDFEPLTELIKKQLAPYGDVTHLTGVVWPTEIVARFAEAKQAQACIKGGAKPIAASLKMHPRKKPDRANSVYFAAPEGTFETKEDRASYVAAAQALFPAKKFGKDVYAQTKRGMVTITFAEPKFAELAAGKGEVVVKGATVALVAGVPPRRAKRGGNPSKKRKMETDMDTEADAKK
jgi:hypothetical protein